MAVMMRSMLEVADNSGARKLQMILPLGGSPGISPRNARPRKHSRHRPNLRMNARGRPQIWQRLCLRVENLGLGSFLSRARLNLA